MEKLTVSSTFLKSVDQLKTTECSSKEKAYHFAQISKLLRSSALKANSSYFSHLSTGITLLLMFCEDNDSSIRNDAQEQLYRIIRFCETNGTIVRVQIDLYHEIKKNGNERSLRICLNLFAYYCHLVRQRKARSYAQNLLPCIVAISKRRENMLLESLTDFLKVFAKYLQICMKDHEVMDMLDNFLDDVPADCAMKRRCAAQNIVTLIENSRKRDLFVMHVLLKSFEYVQRDQKPNTVIGVFGLVRQLIPIIYSLNNINIAKLIEIYEVCLHFLATNTNHGVLNAALELINTILTNPPVKVKVVLTSEALEHKEILFRRKSLKNQIFRTMLAATTSRSESRKSSYCGGSSLRVEGSDSKRSPHSAGGGSSQHLHPMTASQQLLRVEDISLTHSDIDNESFKSLEFDAMGGGSSSGVEGGATKIGGDDKEAETMSLRSQKSTDSIGSFFNSLLTHSNTESVTKFFRTQKSTESPLNSPKNTIAEEKLIEKYTDDNLSFDSMGSSQPSSLLATTTDDSCTATTATPDLIKIDKHGSTKKEIDINDETLSLNEMVVLATEDGEPQSVTMTNDSVSNVVVEDDGHKRANEEGEEGVERVVMSMEPKCVCIGTLFEQTLIEYTVRLICSHFLLAGIRHVLISDQLIRVSIKSLSLQTIASCVNLYPEVMLKQVEKEPIGGEIFDLENLSLDVDLCSPTDDETDAPVVDSKVDNAPTQFLEIKEDHFGECTTSNFIDYFTPLQMTKSLDQGLISLKTKLQMYEDKTSMNAENLNKHLGDILSKSDYTDNKMDARKYCESTTTTEIMETTTQPTIATLASISGVYKTTTTTTTATVPTNKDQQEKLIMNMDSDEQQQFITDVLLFYNHNDPILRGNVQIIIGNFIKSVYDNSSSYKKFIDFHTMDDKSKSFLQLPRLIDVVSKAFNDEIHTVVKQSLNAFEQVFPLLITNEPLDSFVNVEEPGGMVDKIAGNHKRHNIFLDDGVVQYSNSIEVKKFLHNFFHVFKNKYWLVQCKYADIIASMNFNELMVIFGEQFGKVSKDKCLSQLLIMLADNDFRVRNHVSTLIGNFIDNISNNQSRKMQDDNHYCRTINFDAANDFNDDDSENNRSDSLRQFFRKYIVNELSSPLGDLVVVAPNNRAIINCNLAKVLYQLSNQLLEIDNKHQQFGVVTAVKELLRKFNAINFTTIWYEFNLLSIILSYANENLTIAHDLTCQTEMMEIIPNLLAGFSTTNALSTNIIHDAERFLQHILKILNIFYHLFSHTKPILLPKGQKRDIFIGAKELNLINNIGYFGNEHFYLRFYRILKSSYESYKISIHNESGLKMLNLLKQTLNSLAVILEIKQIGSLNNSTKLIDEILLYLSCLISYVPKKCVLCIKQLLKHVFQNNYASKKVDYDYFLRADHTYKDVNDVFVGIKRLKQIGCEEECDGNGDMMQNMANYIKQFQSTVIQCLKLFTKANADLQATILNMLCQLLELKGINYSLLDIKNIFVNFVVKYLELIETNTIRNCHVLVPQIIKFLFHLTKQKDQKLMTIPKIINLTDTLLANSSVRRCAVLSLSELAHQLFFNPTPPLTMENPELYEREMDTQKEVIISMMMKFLDDNEIQQMLSTIIRFNKSSSTANENEIFAVFLQNLKENKISIKTNSSFSTVNMNFNAFEKSIWLQSKNFIQILMLYYDRAYKEINGPHDLSIILLTIEKIISNTDESYLLNHMKLFHEQQQKVYALAKNEQPLTKVGPHQTNEVDYFGKSIKQTIENCLKFINLCPNDYLFGKLFRKYLYCLINLNKFSSVINCWRNILLLENNNNLFMNLVQFSKNHRLKLFDCLFTFKLNLGIDKGILLENYVGPIVNLNDQLRKQHMYRHLFHKYENTATWNAEEIYYLLENDFAILFNNHDGFLTNLIANDIYSSIIVTKINELYGNDNVNIPTKVFDILENVHMISANDAMNFLLTLLCNKNKTIIRRNLKSIYKICENIPDGDDNKMVLLSNDNLILIDSIGRDNKSSDCIQKLVASIKCKFHYRSGDKDDSLAKINFETLRTVKVDELWIVEQVQLHTSYGTPNGIINESTAHLVYEIKSESKLMNILSSKDFNISLLKDLIKITFEHMIHNFETDCVQYNPHLNYLKIPALLKTTTIVLIEHMKGVILVVDNNDNTGNVDDDKDDGNNYLKYNKIVDIRDAVECYMRHLRDLENVCLAYVEAVHVERFFKENFWKPHCYDIFLQFNAICVRHARRLLVAQPDEVSEIYMFLKCTDGVLKDRFLWREFNLLADGSQYLDMICSCLSVLLSQTSFLHHYVDSEGPNLCSASGLDVNQLKEKMAVVFIAKYLESNGDIPADEKNPTLTTIEPLLHSIAISVLRTDQYYSYAVTPYEILINYNVTNHQDLCKSKLPSIPFDCLNDIEILNKFIKRINIFGFSSKQQFEEFFMSLLVLINKQNDPEMIDPQEEFEIKNMCLHAINQLLVSCYMYPNIGSNNGKYHHYPRLERIKIDNIGLKKLHKIKLGMPSPNLFHLPNVERRVTCDQIDTTMTHMSTNNGIGTNEFLYNQFGMKYFWQQIEDKIDVKDVTLINSKFFIEKIGIDIKSSVQLIYDIFTQMIEENYVLVLPHLVKISEMCDNADQFKWIKSTMMALRENVPMENTISHQYIIYLLCKSTAILVPSLSDLTHLCTIIPAYLKSTQLCVRNAALHGLLCLLESLTKTNTKMGRLSDELILIRNIILNYIVKHGIVEESSVIYSDMHTKLVWTLNFYLVETTTKFVADCNLLSNTIISANNILKRTSNLDLYLCILHGLERLVATQTTNKLYREKIEKLAVDLLKTDNELLSIPALKLLITCMYIGSIDQLENTEKSNGIVQDEPEIIIESTEKIDILFSRIRVSTPQAARIFGTTLCQVIQDLLPPNEVLTKIIKELLMPNQQQSHQEVMARITYKVFRTTIDSSYLPLLQDWLICSLPNFLSLPQFNKSIWCLLLIFISASLNQHFIKLIPELYECPSKLTLDQINYFILASKDFYSRLNDQQKKRFKEVFMKTESEFYKNMLSCL